MYAMAMFAGYETLPEASSTSSSTITRNSSPTQKNSSPTTQKSSPTQKNSSPTTQKSSLTQKNSSPTKRKKQPKKSSKEKSS